MLKLNSVMLGTTQPKELVAFYEKVLDMKPGMQEGDWAGWQVGGCFLSVGPHSKAEGQSKEPGRVMFNFETTTVKEEFDRMKAAGAVVVKEPYQMEGMKGWIATLADLDGNYFQLMTPWEDEMKKE